MYVVVAGLAILLPRLSCFNGFLFSGMTGCGFRVHGICCLSRVFGGNPLEQLSSGSLFGSEVFHLASAKGL